jgi:hypothetical protein
MPVYVQWKWQENTQMFLMILHFDPARASEDGWAPNLRSREMRFVRYKTLAPAKVQHYCPSGLPFKECKLTEEQKHDAKSIKKRIVTTWAPSHVEIALVTELLTYANFLNGLKPEIRKSLRTSLDIFFETLEDNRRITRGETSYEDRDVRKRAESAINDYNYFKWSVDRHTDKERGTLWGCEYNTKEEKCEPVFCVELSFEYLEYFKNLLKPHLKKL